MGQKPPTVGRLLATALLSHPHHSTGNRKTCNHSSIRRTSATNWTRTTWNHSSKTGDISNARHGIWSQPCVCCRGVGNPSNRMASITFCISSASVMPEQQYRNGCNAASWIHWTSCKLCLSFNYCLWSKTTGSPTMNTNKRINRNTPQFERNAVRCVKKLHVNQLYASKQYYFLQHSST